jgi:hypothetical protein
VWKGGEERSRGREKERTSDAGLVEQDGKCGFGGGGGSGGRQRIQYGKGMRCGVAEVKEACAGANPHVHEPVVHARATMGSVGGVRKGGRWKGGKTRGEGRVVGRGRRK